LVKGSGVKGRSEAKQGDFCRPSATPAMKHLKLLSEMQRMQKLK
jgi:hypothetical protein